MSHSSVLPVTIGGKKMYIYSAIGGMCGISAENTDIGQILWKTSIFNPSVIAPSPLYLGNGKIFITAGYGAGAAVMQVSRTGEAWSVKMLQMYKPQNGIASEQQTPILYHGFIFAVLPKDAGAMHNEFACCRTDNCQNILWTSLTTDRYGLGPYIMADGKFFILNDDATLTIAKVSTGQFMFLDKAKITEGQDAWGPMAIADGRLLMRDSKTLVCIDIRKKDGS